MYTDEGTVSTTLARHPADRLRYYVPPSETEGRHAVTHYRVLERLGYVTLMECRLETGRTHQIRVHMEHLGHPILEILRMEATASAKGRLSVNTNNLWITVFRSCHARHYMRGIGISTSRYA